MGDARARAIMLAMTWEIERLREANRTLERDTVKYRWDFKNRWLYLYSGEIRDYHTRGVSPPKCTIAKISFYDSQGTKLYYGCDIEKVSPECAEFLREFGLPETTNYLDLCVDRLSIVRLVHYVDDGFKFELGSAGFDCIVINENYDIIRDMFRHCIEIGCPAQIIADKHLDRGVDRMFQ
jgi:hypothetical protein